MVFRCAKLSEQPHECVDLITFLIGVLVNGPSPKAETAAQKPILATVRAKSSAEKFV